jgi:type IV pilus assembly protein PilC
MAYFNYRAVDGESNIVTGRLQASDEDTLEEVLNVKGLTLIEAAKSTFSFSFRGFRPQLNEKDLLDFTYVLNIILSSGVPILSGLGDMAIQTTNKKIALAASSVQSQLESGKSISDSMLEYPDFFPSFYTSMVRAGEVSGNLEQVFNDIMAYLKWQMKLKKDVKSALAYPAIVFTAVVSLVIVLFAFVMPKFIKILSDLKVTLPLPTKILVAVVGFIKGYWPLVILFFIAIPILYRVFYNTASGRKLIDRSLLRIPLLSELIRKVNYSRYFRTFSILFRSGLDMSETLRISAEVVKNTFIADTFKKVSTAVIEGEQISSALRNSGSFPPLLLNMVEVGEKTGTLDNTVVRICDIYDKEVPETIKKVFTILEPLVIVMLGGLVLLTLASFFMALYKIVGGIR